MHLLHACLILLAATTQAAEAPTLPPWLGDDAVVQRDQPLPLSGHAAPGAQVAITFAERTLTVAAGTDGAWTAVLPALPAGGPHELRVTAAGATATASRIMVGDVWLCAGQSNMAFGLAGADGAKRWLKEVDGAQIRLLHMRYRVADTPQTAFVDGQAGWTPSTEASAAGFSAIALAFARRIQAEEAVCIGLIEAAKPGSFCEGWIPTATMAGDPAYAPILDRWSWLDARRDTLQAAWQAEHASWNQANGKRFAVWKELALGLPFQPHEPSPPPPADSPLRPGVLWNGMVAPLTGCPLRGVLWYQGESNSDRAWQYRRLLAGLISAWRQAWRQPALPFIIAQLPEYETGCCPYDWQDQGAWEVLRESQATAGSMPGVATVVTLGLGDPRNIHPRAKWPAGQRCGSAALAVAYHHDVPWSGPRLAEAVRDGAGFRLRFTGVGSGLLAVDGGPVVGCTIAGADRVFVPAIARITAPDILFVSAPQVPEPAAVRYAWADAPVFNLFGGDGLPAAPCRSDDWPVPTQGVEAPFSRRWPVGAASGP